MEIELGYREIVEGLIIIILDFIAAMSPFDDFIEEYKQALSSIGYYFHLVLLLAAFIWQVVSRFNKKFR
jgi:hypothetical protein